MSSPMNPKRPSLFRLPSATPLEMLYPKKKADPLLYQLPLIAAVPP